MFVYFIIIFCLWIVNFWLSFHVCFLLEFWLSLMIMIDSYVDCFLWLLLMIVFDWVLIVFDDCFLIEFWLFFMIAFDWGFFLLSFWLSMMIVFESYVDCLWWLCLKVMLIIDNFWWLFFDYYIFWLFYTGYVFLWVQNSLF